MAEATDREEYKERLRAAGRRALEDFRRQKGAVRSRAAAPGEGPGSGPAQGTDRSPTVELTTFRVVTQPAAATVGPAPSHEPAELALLSPATAMASTSLGALAPGSACLLPAPAPWPISSSSPCSVASGTGGAASVSSLASSTHTGYATPAPSAATSISVCASPGAGAGLGLAGGGRRLPVAEDDDASLPTDMSPGAGMAGWRDGGGADQALVDMLLAQVEALMRDKASLAAENAGLRQQVDQLTELVGWLSLSLERAGSEGDAAGSNYAAEEELPLGEAGEGPPLEGLGEWQARGGDVGTSLPGTEGCGGGGGGGAESCQEDQGVGWGASASGGAAAEGGWQAGGGGPGVLGAGVRERTDDGRSCAEAAEACGPQGGGGQVSASGSVAGPGPEVGRGATVRRAEVLSPADTAAGAVLMEGGPLGPPGPLSYDG